MNEDRNADQRMQDKLANYLHDLIKREGIVFDRQGKIKFVLQGEITYSGQIYWLETEHHLWQEV